MFYRYFLKPLLFLFPAETAHHLALQLFRIQIKILSITRLINVFYPEENNQKVSFCGLDFKNGVGLAAGFDKDAKHIDILQYLGFGFIEVGTVTPRPQKGNPKPRLFRLKEDQAIINRMGFNNEGVEVMVERLKKFENRRNTIIGGNIGKNKDTPNDKAEEDYIYCFNKLHPYVDYFVVNVSSPNTPNLRELQNKEPLKKLLNSVVLHNLKKEVQKPILLKIAPDVTRGQLQDIVEIVNEVELDGLILNNTTISRDNLQTDLSRLAEIGNGGLSGFPLFERSSTLQKEFSEISNKSIPFIGVGGIMDSDSANVFLQNGASLVQIYTGFIYKGPSIVAELKKRLTQKV